MVDHHSLDAAVQQLHQARATTLHGLARAGRGIAQLMDKSGWDLPTTLGYFHHINAPLPISPVMAELVLRLYRQAPVWADSPDQIQLKPVPSDLAELVELVEAQHLNDLMAGMGAPVMEAADG